MENIKKKFLKSSNREKGITLVALVITIVILIILATVAIQFAFGENGLINRAQDAKNYQANADAEQNKFFGDAETAINEALGGTGGDTIEDIKGGEKLDETAQIKDNLGNIVWIPGGFGVADDSGVNVEDGVVIEDNAGNQFVWIPVGEYKVTTEKNSTGKLTNNLTRRSWGEKNVVQNPTEVNEDEAINTGGSYDYYGEGATQDKDGNPITTVAKDQIEAFKTSATTKGGFYIGRYEQGEGNVCKAGVNAYVNVTRDEAKAQSEAMYKDNDFVVSELISSYAWDTALNFMCQNHTEGYKIATTTDKTYGNINTSKRKLTGAYTKDKYSNICDVLGNCWEWTTESCSNSNSPCVGRGGDYSDSTYCAASRDNYSTSNSDSGNSFRLQLYVK